MSQKGRKTRLIDQLELTPLQKRFCLQVAVLHNVRAAARAVGISERTAYRWHDLPLAQRYIAEQHDMAFATAMLALEQMTLSAVLMLNEAMNSEHTENNQKIRAAQLILDYGIEAHKVNALEKRMQELEHRLHMHDVVVREVTVE